MVKNTEEECVEKISLLKRRISALEALDARRIMTEAELIVSEVRYRRLFESAKDGILILDAETGIVDDVNPFLGELLGYSLEQIKGKAVWQLGFLKDTIANKGKFLELQRQEYIRYENLPLETADGRHVNVEFVSNVYLAGGKKVIQCNIRDITIRKRAEEAIKKDKATVEKLVETRTRELLAARLELERSQRLSDIGILAATVAHELRNPLAAISLATYNIKRKSTTPGMDSHLNNIAKKIDESNHIINNLLYYSRIKKLNCERVNLTDILNECIEDSWANNKGKNVTITKRIDRLSGAHCIADPLQLKEVFVNVFNNAFDAVNTLSGKIDVNGLLEDGRVKVVIKDNGVGIQQTEITKIFDPFYTTKAKGTGLGLAVCSQILIMHQGSISVESKPGEYTSFVISLPKSDPNDDTPSICRR